MINSIVMTAKEYSRIDGKRAYNSDIKKLTLGAPVFNENKDMKIAAQIWKENENGDMEVSVELPIHQVFDLMIFLSRTLLYFKEAYRMPLLYDPNSEYIDRVGLQGDAMEIAVCKESDSINEDIQKFFQALSDLGELTGERTRVLLDIIKEL